MVYLNQMAVLAITIWMEGSFPRKEILSTVSMCFLFSPGPRAVDTYGKPLPELTGQVKWKDEGERRGSSAERLIDMTAPRFKTAREKS